MSELKLIDNNIIKFIDSTIYGRHKLDALNLFNESKFFGVGNKNFRIRIWVQISNFF